MSAQERKKEERAPQAKPFGPIDPFETMREVMNRMMDTFFVPLSRYAPPAFRVPLQGSYSPDVDVIEEDDGVRIHVEVPGMTPDDLAVTITQDTVVVRGEKKREEIEGKGVHRAERSYGPFRRVISLPVEVDREKADASFKNGVLTIVVPKSHEAARKVQIRAE